MSPAQCTDTKDNELRSARLRRGFTQRSLARKAGVSQQAIAKWEAGGTAIGLAKAEQLARALGVTKEHLFPSLRKNLTTEQKHALTSELVGDIMQLTLWLAFEAPHPKQLRWFQYPITWKTLRSVMPRIEDKSSDFIAFSTVDRMHIVVNPRALVYVQAGDDVIDPSGDNDERVEPQRFKDDTQLPDETEVAELTESQREEIDDDAEIDVHGDERKCRLYLRRTEHPITDWGGFRAEPRAGGLADLLYELESGLQPDDRAVVQTHNHNEGDVWFVVNLKELQLLETPAALYSEWIDLLSADPSERDDDEDDEND